MLVSEIATRVYRDFGDTTQAQITDADIIRWVNDAQLELVVANELLQVTSTQSQAANVQTFTLPTLIELYSVKWDGMALQLLTQQEADNYIQSNTTVGQVPVGQPQYYWRWGNTVTLLPTPDTTKNVTIAYRRPPNAVTVVGDTPELPVQWHNRIVEYVRAQAYSLDDNAAMYDRCMALFKGNSEKMSDNASFEQQEFYPRISASPEDTEDYYAGFY